MQFFLRDSVIDDGHLHTPIISQQKPTRKFESKKQLLKALRSFKDLSSFLNSRCNNFPSSPPTKQTFFFLCVIIIHVWLDFPAWLLHKQQLLHSSVTLLMLAFMDQCWYFLPSFIYIIDLFLFVSFRCWESLCTFISVLEHTLMLRHILYWLNLVR